MMEPRRILPKEAYRKLKEGEILLVCAYDDEEKFRKIRLEGAISLADLRLKLPSLSRDQEIVFY